MRAIAFVPARAGSKRISGKNLRTVGGVSLVARAVRAALGADCVPVVSTDDEKIAATSRACAREGSVLIHERPSQFASDHAQIETAIAHWWTRIDDKPDAVVLLQPTSPFRTAAHVREALRLLTVTGADSVVGVTVGHEHHFAGRMKPRESDAYGEPVGEHFFDFQPFRDVTADRPRTQDLRPMGAENGALYAFTRAHWERTGNRMGGHMVALPMTRWAGFDVDTEEDIAAANALVAGGVCK